MGFGHGLEGPAPAQLLTAIQRLSFGIICFYVFQCREADVPHPCVGSVPQPRDGHSSLKPPQALPLAESK